MCIYCQYDHGFWDDIVERGKRITILTPEEVEAYYQRHPEVRPEGTEAADDA